MRSSFQDYSVSFGFCYGGSFINRPVNIREFHQTRSAALGTPISAGSVSIEGVAPKSDRVGLVSQRGDRIEAHGCCYSFKASDEHCETMVGRVAVYGGT
jgi:hypothetical protein